MRLFLFTFLVLITCNSIAQDKCSTSYFENSFNLGATVSSSQILLLPGGNSLITGVANEGCYISKIDVRGNVEWNKYYKMRFGYGFGKLCLDKNNNVIGLLNGSLVKIDSANGNVLSSMEIGYDTSKIVHQIVGMDLANIWRCYCFISITHS